jgi:hypothetical protein
MKRAILPVLVIVLGVTSAFTTTAASKSTVAIVEGYLPHNIEGTNCELKDNCSTLVTGAFCRVGQIPSGQRLYIMNENDQCLRVGYKP